MSKRKLIIAVVASMAICAGGPGRASGVVAGATEPTQIMNNLELIMIGIDQATTASTLVSKYATQIQQYQTQLQNLMKLPNLPAALGADALKAYNDLMRLRGALNALQGSLAAQKRAVEARVTEARLSGRGWEGYVADQQNAVKMLQGRAIERLQYEEDVLKQVQSDYDFARDLQSKITTTAGNQQSLQMMNAQMNRVITQNAKLLEVISASIRNNSEADARSAEGLQQSLSDRELMRQRQEAIEKRQRAFGGFAP